MSVLPDADDLRYERKFAPDFSAFVELETRLRMHPSLFRTVHPDRWVNNIYLDTEDLACFRDNVEGNTLRMKYRIRWYGDLAQPDARPVLEIKRKVGLVGSKLRFPLTPFDSRNLHASAIFALLHCSEVADFARESLARMRPVLANRYRRSYLLSADGFRATLDRALSFQPLDGSRGRSVDDPSLVLELKYPRALEARASRVTAELPFRVSRISKYVQGVRRLRAHALGP